MAAGFDDLPLPIEEIITNYTPTDILKLSQASQKVKEYIENNPNFWVRFANNQNIRISGKTETAKEEVENHYRSVNSIIKQFFSQMLYSYSDFNPPLGAFASPEEEAIIESIQEKLESGGPIMNQNNGIEEHDSLKTFINQKKDFLSDHLFQHILKHKYAYLNSFTEERVPNKFQEERIEQMDAAIKTILEEGVIFNFQDFFLALQNNDYELLSYILKYHSSHFTKNDFTTLANLAIELFNPEKKTEDDLISFLEKLTEKGATFPVLPEDLAEMNSHLISKLPDHIMPIFANAESIDGERYPKLLAFVNEHK